MTRTGLVLAGFALAFGLASLHAQTVSVVPTGATWKYLDDGSDQGTQWRNPTFDDGEWVSGRAQLGYGDGDEATLVSFGTNANDKYVTTYFRHSFNLADPSCATNLIVRLLRDDGAVVYINGTEVFRNNMPGFSIGYRTYASSTSEGGTFFVTNAPPGVLVAGVNVVAVEVHQSTPNSSDLSFDFELRAQFAQGSPLIAVQPRDETTLSGNPAVISVLAFGSCPLTYQWSRDNVAIPGATSASLVIAAATTNDAGRYQVVVSNSLATITSGTADLTVIDPIDNTFQIVSLGTNNVGAIEHNGVTGDDRGGIAVSRSHVFVTGDGGTGLFAASDLSGGTSLGRYYEGLATDLRTEKVYSLGVGTNIFFPGIPITTLLEIDGSSGQPNGNVITLSSPIELQGLSGIFSGFQRIVLYSGFGRVFNVALPSGTVTDLGSVFLPQRHSSESWATWGVAEYFDGAVHLVYVRDSQTIVRTTVPSGLTEPVAIFSSLSDMASFTVSLSRRRWYFHHEGGSQFRSGDETVGYADATVSFVALPRPPTIVSNPLGGFVPLGSTRTLAVTVAGSPPFSYQWFLNDEPVTDATNATLQLSPVTLAHAGSYFVVVDNAAGSASSVPVTITVGESSRTMFDDFEPGIDPPQWSQFSGNVLATNHPGGQVSGSNSLLFLGDGPRFAATRRLDTSEGGIIGFYLRFADGPAFPWEATDPNEGVLLEYSIDEGSTWFAFAYIDDPERVWRHHTFGIPVRTPATFFRWRQNSHDGNSDDHWALDDVRVNTQFGPPEIFEHPQSLDVAGGNQVFLGIAAAGSGLLTYQWHFNDTLLDGATNAHIILNNVSLQDAGRYWVVVSNSLGTATSSNAVLRVLDPYITAQPQSQTVVAGDSVGFYVEVQGSSPLTFQWYFGRANRPDEPPIALAGATNQFLELFDLTGAQAGAYSVVISNASGTAISSNAVLEVLDPAILIEPDPRTALLGGTATFSPLVAGTEPVAFQWHRNGAPVPGATNLVLVISNVTMAHAGEYSVTASNAYGTVTSANALLRVVAIGGDEFQILDLLTNNSRVVDHDSLTGDDRGGIAASATRVFYSGDTATARFNIADLSGGTRVGRVHDGLVSNLRNGTVYTLATGSSPINVSVFPIVVDGLIELDGSTGLLTSRRITLSAPITLHAAGIFAGYDRILLHDNNAGQLFHISLPDGAVTDLGFIGYIPANSCDNWAFWGVAEFFNHDLSLVYVYGNTIARTRLSGGAIETVASFSYLSDMCSFTVSLLYDRWYFHYEWQSQFGGISESIGYADAALRSPLPPNPVQILIPPANQAVLEGGTATFSVSARGTRPITYQWQFNNAAIPDVTNSALVLSNVTASMAGSYSVAVSNAISGAVSAAATLRVDPVTGATFQVAGLFNTGSRIVEHDFLTSDDRGGIAASANQVFMSGDAATARFNIEDLSGGVGLGRIYNAMVSNLRTETVYTLANGGTPLSSSGGVVSHLAEIDVTGALRPNRIVLSTSITLPNNNVGIFAGWDRIVLHTGSRAYQILLPSGQVNDLGAMAAPAHMSCETWAYWGVAEFFAGSVYLVAVRDSQTITRTRVPDGLTTELARFSYLGDMCSITVSPYRGRWYFHHEGGSEFGGFAETLGYADASFVFAPILPRITSQPRDVMALDGGDASFTVAAVGGAGRLSYQWRFNDGDLPGETNDLLRLPVVRMSQAGNYSVVVSNSVGAVTSRVAQLRVRALQGFSFRVTSLSASQCAAVEHGQLTGDDRGGIAASSTHVFYSGDFRTARFLLDDLSGGTSLDQVYDALVSNLRTEQIYALANDTGFLTQGGVVTRLVALDGVTALPTGAAIELSQPVAMQGFGAGVFAGFDRIVLYNGLNILNIDLPSGIVTDLGPFAFPSHHSCENWAFWGIAEYFDGGIHLVYVRDFQSIARTRVSDGSTSTVASFNSLSDMCSITFSLTQNRWYFHHEGGSQFGSGSEMVGYCDAGWDQPNTPPVVTVAAARSILEDEALLDAPVTLFDAETAPGALSVAISTSNPDLVPLDHITLTGTSTNRLLRATPVADAYGVAVISIALTDAHGVTSTGSLELTVQPVNDPPAFFKGADQAILEDAALQVVPNWASEIIPGPPNEAGQTLAFLASNDNPALFEVQPGIAPNGTLSFKPAPNAHGIAHVMVTLRDNAGTQNDGQDTSAPQTFQIIVQPVNDPPVAQSQSVSVSEDGSLTILLGAQDIDGDRLSYSLSAPGHGTLSGTPPSLLYAPAANYFGNDSFTFTVNDGQAQSGVGTVSITVGPINDPPSAAIDATSPSMLATNSTNCTVIAPDNAAALIILDGGRSSDIDNDPLQYFWLENDTSFAHGIMTSNLFEVGTHVVVLTVSDGTDLGSTAVVLDVIAPSQAVESLLTLIDDADFDRQNKRPMIATLKAAAASLDRGQFLAALNQLRAFQNKVRAQIAPAYPAEAARWIQSAEDILFAMGAQKPIK